MGGARGLLPLLERSLRGSVAAGEVPIQAVGALTSKPYAFTSRSWELKSVESVDVLDGVGSNVRIDTRGTEIMRVLPRLNEAVNEEWISDKSRFSYDGLKRQRLTTPMVRMNNGEFASIGWEKVPFILRNAVMNIERKYEGVGFEVHAIVGPYVEEEALLALRNMMYEKFPNGQVHLQEQAPAISTDFRENYKFNSTLAGIEQSDACLLIGTNPRKEAPIVNARIRKGVIHNGTVVASVGCAMKLTYPHHHLGTSVSALKEIAEKKHPFSSVLDSAERPSLVVSNRALQRADGNAIFNFARTIADEFGMIKEDWDGFNVLHMGANTVGALDIGVADKYQGLRTVDSPTNPWQKTRILFLLNADDLDNMELPDDCFVIYQGHHGDNGASLADLVLPGAAYTEKAATFVNTEGRVQKTSVSFFPPGSGKSDADALKSLLGPVEETSRDHRTEATVGKIAPHLQKVGDIQDSDRLFGSGISVDPEGRSAAVSSVPLAAPLDNFYMTDPITRSSKVMAKCTRVIKEGNFDY
ncbi:hypothetical protein NDN08_001358 [Rhodosorus marinus]|uniref:4Fe-4S Mo/W bis-MGD-type domain-containing protein n=1 Tax=Rhodosorus marinus TaxID=101924 RepID=A0AAV8UQT4_9RHOD|nr:hypothetical protein NDN08_001358 [Rhodosorus marinus]